MQIVAVIPARSGSKSIPGKNIKELCGKPLIAWSIEAAKAAPSISRVIVSTDSKEIAEVAKRYGAEVPFLRPTGLAGDTVGVEPVLRHTYEWLKEHENYETDALMLLLPTTPTRQPIHLEDLVRIYKETGADSVTAVNEIPANHTPYWTHVRQPDGTITMFDGSSLKDMPVRRQDFPQVCYSRNDIGFILKPANLYEDKPNLFGEKPELYILENAQRYELDINLPEDWEDAELKMTALQKKLS